MTERISPYSALDSVHLKNVLALNYCWNVDTRRILTSDVFTEISERLRKNGNSAIFYGVGNFGFRLVNHNNPVATDGDYEGHHNNPSNDHDIVVVTNANFNTFKDVVNETVMSVKEKYKDIFWAKLDNPEWHGSQFGMPEYCSMKYSRGPNFKNTQMEIHWLQNKKNWHKELLSKYAPWYSTKIGFPIVGIACQNSGNLRTGIWQPFADKINKRKKHQINISVPENFGDNPRDIMQATRIVFGVIQASVAANSLAQLSPETKDILKKGIKKISNSLTQEQKEKASKRLLTLIYRTEKIERELLHFCYIEECKNPFTEKGPVQVMVENLEDVGWFKATEANP